MSDIDQMVRVGYLFQRLRKPVLLAAIQALQFPPGSWGLDVGCGLGLQTPLFAKAVGPAGHVTGLDLSPELLARAEDIVKKAGFSERITFREGDVNRLPFDDDSFDWAWSMDLVGYAPMEPLPLLAELGRVVKPGGSVAILAWSSEKLLPGYPVLEARLGATSDGIAPFARGRNPESHFLRALGWFREAGFESCKVSTFSAGAHAPLTGDERGALESLFEMRWPNVQDELRETDWAEYQRLCLPGSPDYILDQPDYYAFFTYSMFQGRVAG